MTSTPEGRRPGTFQVELDGREALQLSAAVWLGPLAFVYLSGLISQGVRPLSAYVGPLASTFTGVLIAWGVYRLVGSLAGRPRKLAYGAMLAAVFVSALVQAAIDYAINVGLGLVPAPTFSPHDRQTFVVVTLLYLSLYATNLALIWLTSANRALRTQTARTARAEADSLRAELLALRLKLDPHFMFNALGAAGGLAGAGRLKETEAMLMSLSTFLRTSYEIDQEITLAEELEVLNDYLEVERVRFGERLQVKFEIDPSAEPILVPGLLLQPLVENAVKHGVARSTAPVTITVSASVADDRLRIAVENDAPPSAAPGDRRAGLGLATTLARLELRYGDDKRFEAGPTAAGFRVSIELPGTPKA